jgi:Holliday junction DNA helicase RuvB
MTMSDNAPIEANDIAYQPAVLEQLVGQQKVLSVLRTHLSAYWNDRAAGRTPVLSHCLFAGPPGSGKTQVATILAKELAVPLVTVTADALRTAEATHRLLVGLEPDSILFIDEIHALSRCQTAETILLKALAEGKVCIGGGRSGKPTTIDLPRFTCIGATTDPWSLHPATIQRFFVLHFDFYSVEDLTEIARRRAKAMAVQCEVGVLDELAKRAKETPRICLALLRACHKTARSENTDGITLLHVTKTMEQMGVDEMGLDGLERKYLGLIAEAGGCVRLRVLALRLGLPARSLTHLVEPFLMRKGLIASSELGRELTPKGTEYMKRTAK